MSAKIRKLPLNRLLVRLFPNEKPDRLYAEILCGDISVNGDVLKDPKHLVPETASVARRDQGFVSRGGEKLQGALDDFQIDPQGVICLDAGASTGGFSDCLLQRGALCVHAVDVGYNQLAWKIRSDSRVVARERTNIMDLSREDLTPPPALAVADLSFRSLRGAASKLLELTAGGTVLALVKPQFENPAEEGFDGIVRTDDARRRVLYSLTEDLPREGVYVHNAAASRVTGRKGNAEIFLLLAAERALDKGSVISSLEKSLDDAGRYSRLNRKLIID